jgi:hypothetical protein
MHYGIKLFFIATTAAAIADTTAIAIATATTTKAPIL